MKNLQTPLFLVLILLSINTSLKGQTQGDVLIIPTSETSLFDSPSYTQNIVTLSWQKTTTSDASGGGSNDPAEFSISSDLEGLSEFLNTDNAINWQNPTSYTDISSLFDLMEDFQGMQGTGFDDAAGFAGDIISDALDALGPFGIYTKTYTKVDVGLDLIHGLNNTALNLEYPIQSTFSVEDFYRGDTVTISIDTSFVEENLPSFNLGEIGITKEIEAFSEINATFDVGLGLGMLGQWEFEFGMLPDWMPGGDALENGWYSTDVASTEHLIDLNYKFTASILKIGEDTISGNLGLIRRDLEALDYAAYQYVTEIADFADQPIDWVGDWSDEFLGGPDYSYDSNGDGELDARSNLFWNKDPRNMNWGYGNCGNTLLKFPSVAAHYSIPTQPLLDLVGLVSNWNEDQVNNFLEEFPLTGQHWWTTAETLTFTDEGFSASGSGGGGNFGVSMTARRVADNSDEYLNRTTGAITTKTDVSNQENWVELNIDFVDMAADLNDKIFFSDTAGRNLYTFPFDDCRAQLGLQTLPNYKKPKYVAYASEFGAFLDLEDLNGSVLMTNVQSVLNQANAVSEFTGGLSSYLTGANANALGMDLNILPQYDNKFGTDLYLLSLWDYFELALVITTSGTAAVPVLETFWAPFDFDDLKIIDFMAGWDLIDAGAYAGFKNVIESEYNPNYSWQITLDEPRSFSLDSGITWIESDTIILPLDQPEFQLASTCEDYSIDITPTIVADESIDNFVAKGLDQFNVGVNLDLFNMDFQLRGNNFQLIPGFTIKFICVDNWNQFSKSALGCAKAALKWAKGAWCCFKKKIKKFKFKKKCKGCWKDTGECSLCKYGWKGLRIPDFSMQRFTGYKGTNIGFDYDLDMSPYVSESKNIPMVMKDSLGHDYQPVPIHLTALPFNFDGVSAIQSSPLTSATDRNGKLTVENRIGGHTPLTLRTKHLGALDTAYYNNAHLSADNNFSINTQYNEVDVLYDLNDEDQAPSVSALLSDFRVQDANLCFADYIGVDSTYLSYGANEDDFAPEMKDVAVPSQKESGQYCPDTDNDGCQDCSIEASGNPANDGTDTDGDGICNVGDNDDDGDGVLDANDTHPLDPYLCGDTDFDTCDDCSSGTFNPSEDGQDYDGDGICDDGDNDNDNDGADASIDTNDSNPNICIDSDYDECDDCSSGTFDPMNDGDDLDGDGLCDSSDDDRDGDGYLNEVDVDPDDHTVCADIDEDGCDDCTNIDFVYFFYPDTLNDGFDFDGDGQCNANGDDTDDDGVTDDMDADPDNPFYCGIDSDEDGCDDCSSGDGENPMNDGIDTDGDGRCDFTDPDIDGDGSVNDNVNWTIEYFAEDFHDYDPSRCLDIDLDGCDDCANTIFTVDSTFTDIADENGAIIGTDTTIAYSDVNHVVSLAMTVTLNTNSTDTTYDYINDSGVITLIRLIDNTVIDETVVEADISYIVHGDGADFDGDGICDYGDNDIDGDGVPQYSDKERLEMVASGELECFEYVYYMDADGDSDSTCVSYEAPGLSDIDSLNYASCFDLDLDGCDDCTALTFSEDGTIGEPLDYSDTTYSDTLYIDLCYLTLKADSLSGCDTIETGDECDDDEGDCRNVTYDEDGNRTCRTTLNYCGIDTDGDGLVQEEEGDWTGDCPWCECYSFQQDLESTAMENYEHPEQMEVVLVFGDGTDTDHDGICDLGDTNVDEPNPEFRDMDGDGVEAFCDCNDACLDADDDGVCDECVDDDSDGICENYPGTTWGEPIAYYPDADGDGYAHADSIAAAVLICHDANGSGTGDTLLITGYTHLLGDCDDADDDTTLAPSGYDCDGNCLADADGDGVCDEFEVAGCTDTSACNYDPANTEEDDSCLYQDAIGVCGGDCLTDTNGDGVCDD